MVPPSPAAPDDPAPDDPAPDDPAPDDPAPPGAVLRLAAEAGQPVRIAWGVLVEALTAVADVTVVAFTDDPAEAAVLAHALAGRMAGDVGGVATHTPVVDALKRVEGDVVRETVDRSTLTRVVAPAIVRGDVLRSALAADTGADAIVAPLALVARTTRLLPR